jgi:hypothetical protein
MRVGVHGVRGLIAAGVVLAVVAACQPSAPPGFTGSQPAGSGAAGASLAPPDSAGLVPGKSVVTTDGGVVTVVGISGGRSPDFDLPAGSAEMVVTPCASNQVIPFVTLYDAKDNKLSIVVEPTATLANLTGGAYYLDVATNPTCSWKIVISPG